MTAVDAGAGSGRSPFSPGALLADRFILRRRLAVGGSGEVWVASNRSTGGAVAIKLVRASGSALNVARFRQEASLSAALAHRNVVRVYDFFETKDGVLGLVMECLRGETARERLERAGPFNPRAAVALITQALAGLAHAHDHRIIHRDIKPPNLFLSTDPDGTTTTKILDFGVAHTPSNTVHTLHGQMLGTPRYMSPEQIRADGPLDGRSDVFSVAIVLYELLTGKCPFAAPFPTASLAAVLESKVERDEKIPEALWALLERALSKDREVRPANARVFADELRRAVDSTDGVLAQELHRSRPPPAPFTAEPSDVVIFQDPKIARAKRVRRIARRAPWIVLGVMAASIVILGVAVVRRGVSPRATSANVAAILPTAPAVVDAPPISATPIVTAPPPVSAPSVAAEPTPPRATPGRRAPAPPKAKIVRDPGF